MRMNSTINSTIVPQNTSDLAPQVERVLLCSDIAIFTIYAVIGVMSLLGNGLTIFIIAKNPTFHTLYNFLLLNLAVADFISGLFIVIELPILVFKSQTTISDQFSAIFCKVINGVIYLNIVVSINTLTAIAFERYFGITKPIAHRNMTKERLKYIIIFAWLGALGATVALLELGDVRMGETTYYCGLSNDESNWPPWKIPLFWFGIMAVYSTPLCVIYVLYCRIILHLRKGNRSNTVVSENSVSLKMAAKRSAKTVRLLILITLVFTVAIIPELVYFALVNYDRKFVNDRLFYQIGLPTVASIAVNPFMYTLSNSTFRQEVIRVLQCRSRRGNQVMPAQMTTLNRPETRNVGVSQQSAKTQVRSTQNA